MNITGPARLIPAAALAALLATSAEAYEQFPISTHGDWKVAAEIWDDGSMSCAASTTRRASTLDITITDKSDVSVYILFDNPDGNGQILPLDLVIEGVTRWQMDDFVFTEAGAAFSFASVITALEFMVDIQRGASVKMTQPGQDKAYGSWSLRGSRDAIDAMFDCYRKIAGVAA